jgi:hypothetical protein
MVNKEEESAENKKEIKRKVMTREDIEIAVQVLSNVLDNWVHGGDADCIIAEFEELLIKQYETSRY